MDVAEMAGERWYTRSHVVAAVRILGLVAIFLVATRAVEPFRGTIEETPTLFGICFVVGALWLFVSGTFGYGSPQRSDWVGVIPFLVALVVREVLTLHSVEEIEISFADKPYVKHSVVYALVQLFYAPLVSDAHSFTMHLNGVLGAYACLPLYLFVRQRVASPVAGFLCALFLAVHPIVARFAPTDGPYSLMLATWFSGLVLLVHPLEPRALLGGGLLLGIAATTRIEGVVILAAAALLFDPRRLVAGARADPLVALLAVLIVASLGVVQMFAQLRYFWGMPTSPYPIVAAVTEAVWLGSYSDASFACLVWFGAVVGIVKRFRLGLYAFLATLIVVAPIAPSSAWIPAHHRLVPTCALQAIVAGMGAYALTAGLPWRATRGWQAVIPGVLLALSLLLRTHAALSEPHPFTEQYDIIRAHLAPGGAPLTECALMAFDPTQDTLDLHSIAQVVPEIRSLDCNRVDCGKALEAGGCLFYFRTTTAYSHPAGLPPDCTAAAAAGRSDATVCLSPLASRLEGSMDMQPVETRVVTLEGKISPLQGTYPAAVTIGLFRVRPW